jgi:hypothetical protein
MKWPFQKPETSPRESASSLRAPSIGSSPDLATLRELYRAMFRARCVDEVEACTAKKLSRDQMED